MESSGSAPVMATRRSWLVHRATPVAGACAAAVTAVLLAANDPSAADSRFPACQFRAVTGLWCPGCGLTRGTHALLNGDVVTALGHNVFTPFALAALAAGWWSWTRVAWDRAALPLPRWLRGRGAWALLAVAVTYGVLRNIPIAPFDALAP